MMNRNDILKRMNTALSELHRCHNELAALESAADHKPDIEFQLDNLAECISKNHPKHKSASIEATGRALYEIVSRSLNPVIQMDHIQNHHTWRCVYDWPTRIPQMVPQLVKWIKDEALNPIPSDAEGEALLNPVKLTKREQEAEQLRREQGW